MGGMDPQVHYYLHLLPAIDSLVRFGYRICSAGYLKAVEGWKGVVVGSSVEGSDRKDHGR